MRYLELFNLSYVQNSPIRGVIKPRDIDYIKNIYNHNLTKIIEYYHSRNFAIKNTFLLSRLLENISVNLSSPVDVYYNYLRNTVPYVAKHYKFTSEIERGVIHHNTFFGSDNSHILLYIDEYENPFKVSSEWEYYNPIRVYKHNVDDLNLLLPNGKNYEQKPGIASVGINLSLLVLKYREFIRQQVYNEASGLPVLTKNHFIYKYVLGPMMEDVIDHIFLNRIMNKFYGIENTIPKFKHVFPIFKPVHQIERYVDDTLNVITRKNFSFVDILANIQLPIKLNALELLLLPDVAPTSQVKWAMYVSRLDHMVFLLDVAKNKDASRMYINHWKTITQRLLHEQKFFDLFSSEEEKAIKEKMQRILDT